MEGLKKASDVLEEVGKKFDKIKQQPKPKKSMDAVAVLRNISKKLWGDKVDLSHITSIVSIAKSCHTPAYLLIFKSEQKIRIYFDMEFFFSSWWNFSDMCSNSEQENIEKKLSELMEYLQDKCLNTSISEEPDTFNKLLKSIGDNNEDRVKDLGDQLFDNLLRDKENDKVKELIDQLNKVLIPDSKTKSKKDADIIKNVWIFCNYSDNDYPWEWIHWKNGDLFWGDKFHLVRIPVNYKFEELDFQINLHKVTSLIDKSCPPAWRNHHNMCKLLKDFVECQEIPLNDPNMLTNLKDFGCTHIGAYRDTFEKDNKFLATISAKLSENKPNFLFFNTYVNEPSSKHCYLSASIKPSPPTTWIDSSLNIPEKCASHFVICFYKVLKDFLNNKKEATIVETVAKTREIINDQYLFSIDDGNLEEELNKEGPVPERLREIFQNNGIPLSKKAIIAKEDDGKWLMTDKENKSIYLIIKDEGTLNIYNNQKELNCDRFWRFAYVINGNPCTMLTCA